MVEIKSIQCNSIECSSTESIEHNFIDTSIFRLNQQFNQTIDNQQFRLNKISEIEDYFIAEIKERELMRDKLSKYIPFKAN